MSQSPLEPAIRKVVNLKNKNELIFVGITSSEAVISAYAQEHKNYNTWEYTQYKYKVEFANNGCICCDWYCKY